MYDYRILINLPTEKLEKLFFKMFLQVMLADKIMKIYQVKTQKKAKKKSQRASPILHFD